MSQITSGDDIALEYTLKKNDAVFAIDSGATIQASILTRDKATVLVAPKAVLEATTGSDWANSKIIVTFDEADTVSLTTFGAVWLEVEVNDGGKLTWHKKLELVKGTI